MRRAFFRRWTWAAAAALTLAACSTAPQGPLGHKGVDTAASARPGGPFTAMRCGQLDLSVRANAEVAELQVGGKRYLLQAQRSASGARYASSAYPGTSFWSKGERGMLMTEGQAHPECVPVASPDARPAAGAPPRDLTVREWVVDRIDGRGVVDGSRTTLTFTPEGQVAGKAGCNRYTGGYRLQGAGFDVSGVATTRMVCVPALMEQEGRFLQSLGAATGWRILPDGRLELSGPGGVRLSAR